MCDKILYIPAWRQAGAAQKNVFLQLIGIAVMEIGGVVLWQSPENNKLSEALYHMREIIAGP